MAESWVITVPPELADKSLASFFRGWDWLDDPPQRVILDFSQTNFVAPWAATLFAGYALWLREVREKDVEIWLDAHSRVGVFLRTFGFTELLHLEIAALPGPGGRYSPLARFHRSSEVAPLARSVIGLLQIEDEEIEGAVQYSLVELMRNVVQHASSRIGGLVSAAYFPKTGLVEVTVADIGRGIQSALKTQFSGIRTDAHALKFALQPHVSGTFEQGAYHSMHENAGLGLFFIKEIVQRSGAGLFLGSGSAMANIWGNADGTAAKRYLAAKRGGWRGTFAYLQFRRELIADFDSLLEVCRTIAAEVRRDPTELALDFVDEVPDIAELTVVRVKEFEEDVDEARRVRREIVIPTLAREDLIVLDFTGVRFATQSFAHACLYEVLRDRREEARVALTLAGCSAATEEAIRAVAAYAKVGASSR